MEAKLRAERTDRGVSRKRDDRRRTNIDQPPAAAGGNLGAVHLLGLSVPPARVVEAVHSEQRHTGSQRRPRSSLEYTNRRRQGVVPTEKRSADNQAAAVVDGLEKLRKNDAIHLYDKIAEGRLSRIHRPTRIVVRPGGNHSQHDFHAVGAASHS